MSYLDNGYNEWLTRLPPPGYSPTPNVASAQRAYDQTMLKNPSNPANPNLELGPDETNFALNGIQGEKITSVIDGDLIGQGIRANNVTVGEMSFDRAKGGTLTLGGKDNENGVLALQDEEGNEKVSMNKEGIIAKDKEGETTFKVNAATGEAFFKGEIQPGSIVTGQVNVGNSRIIIDGEKRTIVVNDGVNDRVLIGYLEGKF